jgi:hypothetical protein
MKVESRDLFKVYDDDAVSLVRNNEKNRWDIVLGGVNTELGISQSVIDSMKKTKSGQLYPIEHHISVTVISVAKEYEQRNITFTEQAKENLAKLLRTLI